MRAARIAVVWMLAVGLWALDRAEAPRDDEPVGEAPLETTRLLDLEESSVVAVRLVEGAITMRLARQADGWIVVEPADTAAPADLASAFVESLLGAVVLDAVELAARPEGEFGLDETRRIEIESVGGSRRVLVIGRETPTGTAAYVRDGGDVRVIGRNLLVYRALLVDTARAPRDTKVPTGPVAQVPLTRTGPPG